MLNSRVKFVLLKFSQQSVQIVFRCPICKYTDEKENQIFLILCHIKEIQNGAVAKHILYEEGLPNI
jgi:hypothetical protein